MPPCTRWPPASPAVAPPRLPFALTGIRLHATAATRLHVELTATGTDTYRLRAADPTGAPVLSIDTLTLRELPPSLEAPAPAGPADSVFELSWPPLFDRHQPPTGHPAGWAVASEQPDRLPAGLRTGRCIPSWPP